MSEKKKIQKVDTGAPPSTYQPRMGFDDFAQAIKDKGYLVEITKAMTCPCQDPATGNALSDCMNCGGTGYFFVEKKESKVVIQSLNLTKKFNEWTENNIGTVEIICLPQDKMAYMDKVIMKEVTSEYYQKAVVKYNKQLQKYFCVLNYAALEVDNLYLFLSSNEPLKLVSELDYEISKNGILFKGEILNTLEANKNIEKVSTVAIRYKHNPTFHIFDINRESIIMPDISKTDGRFEFPANYLAKRANFIFDAPNLFSDRLFDNTNKNKKDCDDYLEGCA